MEETAAASSASPPADVPYPPTVQHVVMFRYKPSATAAQIRQVTEAFKKLTQEVRGVVAYENGVNNSPEPLSHGFAHVHLVTLESLAARDTYLTHDAHLQFQALLDRLGIVEDALVFDYHPRSYPIPGRPPASEGAGKTPSASSVE